MELSDALIQIADKLGITVQQVYELFVGVQETKGIILIIQIFTFLIGIYLYLNYLWKITEEMRNIEKYRRSELPNILMIFGGMFGIMTYFFTLLLIGNAVLQIMYPEYFGAKELIETLLKFR